MPKPNKKQVLPESGFKKLKTDLELTRGKGLSIEKLRSEHNFVEYLKLLKMFAKRYTVFVAASDTPWGPPFLHDMTVMLMEIGLKVNLFGMFRRSYAAIVDAGELIYESLSPSVSEAVEYDGTIGDIPIKLRSAGYDVQNKHGALISVNGKQYSQANLRGLSFVVFDAVTKHFLDSVSFDIYLENFPHTRPEELIAGLLEYENAHPEISVLSFNLPILLNSNLSENEEFLVKNKVMRGMILQNLGNPIFVLNKYFPSSEGIVEALTTPKSYLNIDGVRRFEDSQGVYVNTSGGHRVTVGQLSNYKRTVYIVGGCAIFGIGASDKGTVASHLQKLLNELAPEQEMIVQNYGFYLADLSKVQTLDDELTILRSLPVRPGDIVLTNWGFSKKIPHLDMSMAARRPHDYGEVFYDSQGHHTEDGYRMIADKLFERLKKENFFAGTTYSNVPVKTERQSESNEPDMTVNARKELDEYKKDLSEFYDSVFKMAIGAVVMNCNPFTLGHRYLIEQALRQVNYLMIFVVQEDLSIFPFDDRLRLVNEGVADLKNVAVIPSGKFIISSLTFSEYFNKSEMQDRVVDSSLDVTLFAREIAPCLNITTRFVGEEPFDKVTKQYNDTLRSILPQYGIQLVEIPRKELEGLPISASHVRKLLEEKDFGAIAKIVPKTTLDYLTRTSAYIYKEAAQ